MVLQNLGWILRFLRVRFCDFTESAVDSAGLWNRWLFEVGRGRKDSTFLQKQKSSKKLFRLCVCRIWDGFVFIESRGNCRICGMDSVVLQNLVWILALV